MHAILIAAVGLVALSTWSQHAGAFQAEVDDSAFKETVGSDVTSPSPIGKEDISYGTHKSWYDANKDQLRFPPASSVKPDLADVADRHSRKFKEPTPEKIRQQTGTSQAALRTSSPTSGSS